MLPEKKKIFNAFTFPSFTFVGGKSITELANQKNETSKITIT